jgi:hypothetical protein
MGAQGTAVLNFGAFPGTSETTADVTGQSGFTSTSLAEAWVVPKATADHTADEHVVEALDVMAAHQADGTIRIYGSVRPFAQTLASAPAQRHRLYGQWTVGWVWN